MPTERRPRRLAASNVVPVPQNGSSTIASGRTGGKNGDQAQLERIGREMQRAPLGVFRQDAPDVGGLAALAMVAQKVETLGAQLLGAAGKPLAVRMRDALLTADDHSKIRQRPGAQLAEHRGERGARRALFARRESRRELDLPLVAHPRNAGRGYDGAIHHARLPGFGAHRRVLRSSNRAGCCTKWNTVSCTLPSRSALVSMPLLTLFQMTLLRRIQRCVSMSSSARRHGMPSERLLARSCRRC